MQPFSRIVFIECERRRTKHSSFIPEFSRNHTHVATPRERLLVDHGRSPLDEEAAGLADATAYHDKPRIEQVHDADKRLSEYRASLEKDASCDVITFERGIDDVLGGHRVSVPTSLFADGVRRVGGGRLFSSGSEGRTAEE